MKCQKQKGQSFKTALRLDIDILLLEGKASRAIRTIVLSSSKNVTGFGETRQTLKSRTDKPTVENNTILVSKTV